MADACREMRAALGAAAIGGLEPAEEVALRAHLDGCADCRTELVELQAVARALPLADPARVTARADEPPLRLGDQVLGRVAQERARHNVRVRRRFASGAAAALAIAAAVAAFVVVGVRDTNPGTRVVFPATAGVSGRATLHARAAGTEVAFHATGLHDGEYYWLWLTGEDGERIAAGTVHGTGKSVDVTMNAALPLGEARRIWMTDERNHVVLDHRIATS
jgi:hypothetical protein